MPDKSEQIPSREQLDAIVGEARCLLIGADQTYGIIGQEPPAGYDPTVDRVGRVWVPFMRLYKALGVVAPFGNGVDIRLVNISSGWPGNSMIATGVRLLGAMADSIAKSWGIDGALRSGSFVGMTTGKGDGTDSSGIVAVEPELVPQIAPEVIEGITNAREQIGAVLSANQTPEETVGDETGGEQNAKRKCGRKPASEKTRANDKDIADLWASGDYSSKKKLAEHLEKPDKEVRRAIDNNRQRETRKNNRSDK